MDQEVIWLMSQALEDALGQESVAFQPSDEDERFIISVDESVILVDAERKLFVPVKRGKAIGYLDIKGFMQELGLEYESPTTYRKRLDSH